MKIGQVLSIDSVPQKTNSSYGNWVVNFTGWNPLGNNRLADYKYFWKKADALTWIKEIEERK